MPGDVTRLLDRLRTGDRDALDRLVPLLYRELRGIAHRHLRNERDGHTLNTTALVNEAYVTLLGQRKIEVTDRVQFFAVAATTMRRILIDYARARKRQKRGGGMVPVPLDQVEPFLSVEEASELLALDDALERLAAVNPRGAEVVQHRFFAGLSLDESASVLGVSTKTAQREWTAARAWLRKEVAGELPDGA